MDRKLTKKEQEQVDKVKKLILKLHKDLSKVIGEFAATAFILKIPFEIIKQNEIHKKKNSKEAKKDEL